MKRLVRSVIAAVLIVVMLVSSAAALTVDEALELLGREYLNEIPPQAYEAETLEELFELLGDPYTYYMSAEEYEAFLGNVENTVELVGIGVSIQYTEQGIYILDALKNGSAYAAGIQGGDYIVAIDGVPCAPADETHRAMILGEEGTQVTVTILRDGVTTDYVLTRTHVVVNNTEVWVENGHIGFIECTSFGSNTGALFLEGVTAYDSQVDYWLVDLRDNTGGRTDAAVDALGVFSGWGYLLYLKDRQGTLYYYGYEDGYVTDHMAVILVNGNSASASEAFTAGMRDIGLGVTVGSRTFGKGVAQVIYDGESMPEYFTDDALKVTAYRFYSAYGITTDQVGVIPTFMVADEVAYDVAIALCGNPEAKPYELMEIQVDGYHLFVDLTTTSAETLAAIFEALPPNAYLVVYKTEEEQQLLTVEQAAEFLGVTYNSRWFTDVDESPFFIEINSLATYGIVEGNGKGSFYPQNYLKRSEVCAMLGRALGLKGSGARYFSDVDEGDPCAPYINAMAELGLINGVGDGAFNPNGVLSQQEYYTMLGRILCYLDVNYAYEAELISEDHRAVMKERGFHDWAVDSAVLVEMAGALYTASGTTEPTAPILRGEAAANLHTVLAGLGILPN